MAMMSDGQEKLVLCCGVPANTGGQGRGDPALLIRGDRAEAILVCIRQNMSKNILSKFSWPISRF